ncbi:MAG TPA: DNA cytosine methyltransferase [Bryobacteraceae bacterium]
MAAPLTFYEFFAGGGMARIGLGPNWRCTFANEWCDKKAASYKAHFGGDELRVDDVAKLSVLDLPGVPTLVWGSFPCQDLSLAGPGAGLNGDRSGTFKPFWNLISEMASLKRAPKIVVLENVVGALSSHGGRDFTIIVDSLAHGGRCAISASVSLTTPVPNQVWHTRSLMEAHSRLPERLRNVWEWWTLPLPNVHITLLNE